jgi:hypothetical protein
MSVAQKRQRSLVVAWSRLDRAQARSHVLEQMEGRISLLVLPLWLIRIHMTRGLRLLAYTTENDGNLMRLMSYPGVPPDSIEACFIGQYSQVVARYNESMSYRLMSVFVVCANLWYVLCV